MKRVVILLSVMIMVAPYNTALAQTIASYEQVVNKKSAGVQTATSSEQPRQVSVKIEGGERITLRNRFGPIIVTGGKGDTVEASVTEVQRGTGVYKFQVVANRSPQNKIMIMTDVTTGSQTRNEMKEKSQADRQSAVSGKAAQLPPAQPAPSQPQRPATAQPQQPRAGGAGTGGARGGAIVRNPRPAREQRTDGVPSTDALRGIGEIKLEVRLPHNARVELIDSRRYAIVTSGTPSYLTNTRNNVSVTNIDMPVSIISSGEVQVVRVGGVDVKTRAGNVQVKEVSGQVSITTVMGAIVVRETDGDVRAVSISGTITVDCAGGRTEASTTNGSINISGARGDVEASTTGGTITFTGPIREGGRYRLRSMSATVRMLIQREPPGFLASLSSYKGQILVEFPLQSELSANTATSDLPATQGQPVRRTVGRYGDGGARITLDSFSGTVQLSRAQPEALKSCP